MSVSAPHPPIPRQPLGGTFLVAISLLGLVAGIQLIAVIIHYLPVVKQQVSETAVRAQVAEQAPTPMVPTQATASAQKPVIAPADRQRAERLFQTAQQNFRVGQFDASLKALEEVEGILPGDPAILWLKAQVLEQLERPQDAIAALDEMVRFPGLPAENLELAEKKLSMLAQSIPATSRRRDQSATNRAVADDNQAMRDSVGLRPGASLGIVSTNVSDPKVGSKNLRIAVKSRPASNINVQDVKIVVYFYEENEEGEVILTDSKVNSQWQSPPIDWADDLPEILDVQYPLPDAEHPGRKYHGYVVGVYYKSELQDFQAEPGRLANEYPLELFQK